MPSSTGQLGIKGTEPFGGSDIATDAATIAGCSANGASEPINGCSRFDSGDLHHHAMTSLERSRDRIITNYEYPPIPSRLFDYSARRDGYEPGDPLGWGACKEDAIRDLLEQEDDRDHPEPLRLFDECGKCGGEKRPDHICEKWSQ